MKFLKDELMNREFLLALASIIAMCAAFGVLYFFVR